MGEFSEGDLVFNHSGLCQTCLPHSRLLSNDAIWERSSGRFHLMVTPGAIRGSDGRAQRVGVPYGTKARIIMIYLQTEGVKSRTVSLGKSMTQWIRRLGLNPNGGKRGNITAIKEQALRIARCEFTLQFEVVDGDANSPVIIKDQRLVKGLSLWQGQDDGTDGWNATVELDSDFHEHLRNHAVPLDNRAIAYLKDSNLGLDLYALLAYRLPKLREPFLLRWSHLREQIGAAAESGWRLSSRVRPVLDDVLTVYPDAKVEAEKLGLRLYPSKPAVPKTMVQGLRLLQGSRRTTPQLPTSAVRGRRPG